MDLEIPIIKQKSYIKTLIEIGLNIYFYLMFISPHILFLMDKYSGYEYNIYRCLLSALITPILSDIITNKLYK
jgi:hypothetical protein